MTGFHRLRRLADGRRMHTLSLDPRLGLLTLSSLAPFCFVESDRTVVREAELHDVVEVVGDDGCYRQYFLLSAQSNSVALGYVMNVVELRESKWVLREEVATVFYVGWQPS